MPWGLLAVMIVASLAVALFVSWPLLVGKGESDADEAGDPEESAVDELLVQKEAVYSAIKELEFDHAMGNLSKEDYKELARRYEDRAVALLQTIDEASEEDGVFGRGEPPAIAGVVLGRTRSANPEDAIEQEVAALRSRRRTRHGSDHGVEDEIEAQVAALRAGKARDPRPASQPVSRPLIVPAATCPGCKAAVRDASAAFCSKCGASLREKCPGCGQPVEKGDAFCSGCGASLAQGGTKAMQPVSGGKDA